MREIKFRAWSKRNGMEPVEDLYWFEENGVHDGTGEGHHGEMYHLMQFTGLHDVKGKEIYEGDLLKDGTGIRQVVWDEERAMFKSIPKREEGAPMYVTVIGNIYETPELIKG